MGHLFSLHHIHSCLFQEHNITFHSMSQFRTPRTQAEAYKLSGQIQDPKLSSGSDNRRCNKIFAKKDISSIPSRFRPVTEPRQERVAIRRPFAPIRAGKILQRPVSQACPKIVQKMFKASQVENKDVVDLRTNN